MQEAEEGDEKNNKTTPQVLYKEEQKMRYCNAKPSESEQEKVS